MKLIFLIFLSANIQLSTMAQMTNNSDEHVTIIRQVGTLQLGNIHVKLTSKVNHQGAVVTRVEQCFYGSPNDCFSLGSQVWYTEEQILNVISKLTTSLWGARAVTYGTIIGSFSFIMLRATKGCNFWKWDRTEQVISVIVAAIPGSTAVWLTNLVSDGFISPRKQARILKAFKLAANGESVEVPNINHVLSRLSRALP